MTPHSPIKIYHIVHIDNLSSIVQSGFLFSDAEMRNCQQGGVVIGMSKIKDRRLTLPLMSHKGLRVGECVPFYFCPRSPMLYMLDRGNSPEIEYRGGQRSILHLVADLYTATEWSDANSLRWAFTDSNAGSNFFEDYTNFADLEKIDWEAVNATQWSGRQDKKQAEFLVENRFPWELIEEIGVYSHEQLHKAQSVIGSKMSGLQVKIQREWYY